MRWFLEMWGWMEPNPKSGSDGIVELDPRVSGPLGFGIALAVTTRLATSAVDWPLIALGYLVSAVLVGVAGFNYIRLRRRKAEQPDMEPQIDALLGDGMDLLDDLSQPLVAGEGGRLELEVDDETADRIWDLYDGAFALLERERRAYLPLLADAINAAVAKRVPARITMQIPSKTRSNEDEIRAFYEANRAYPKAIVEGTLDGLAEVGRSLGHPRPQRTGIETEGGELRSRGLRIRNQDRGIASKDTKTDLEDTEIE